MKLFKTLTVASAILMATCFAGIVIAEPKPEKLVEVDPGAF